MVPLLPLGAWSTVRLTGWSGFWWLGHQRVSTPDDPASARLGESSWEFLPRTVLGGLRSAWRIQSGAAT